jgi:iron complex outermembrane receptor protein
MKLRKKPISKAVALALITSTYLSPQLFAQEDEETPENDNFERITVTSQKRVENINEVPIAVSVLREDQINAAFAPNIEGLQALVPSVSFRKGNTTRNSALTVRGIGTVSFSIAAEPSVSTVVDNVVLGRSGQAFTDLYDLERIEVLRGPQGTLFGKNASAGVVNITTKRPTDEFEGMIEATLFQDNEYRIRGRVSGGLSDNVAGSLTVVKSEFDGYIFNVFNNQDVNGYDKEGLRGVLDIDAGNETDILVIFETFDSNDDCCADIQLLPNNRNPNSEALPDSQGVVNGVADIDLGNRLVDHDFETRTIDEQTAFSFQIDRPFGDYTFTSITAFRNWENTEFREGDFTSIGGTFSEPVFGVPFQLHDVGPQEWDQFSQEFRFASPIGQTIEYQVGLFYWNQESERSFTRDASCQNNNGQFISSIQTFLSEDLGVVDPTAEQAQDFIDAEGLTCLSNDIVSATAFMETEFENFAVFADGRYNITDDFRLLFGARLTRDEISFQHNRVNNDEFRRTGVGVRTVETNFDGETDETDFSIKIGAQWDVTDGSNLYASFSQGYKGPAFNVFFNMAESDTLPIGPETSDAFEIGYKYASSNLLFNAAIFRTEIDGFQANNPEQLDGVFITRLTNAGSVITEGFEFDFLYRATDSWTLSGGLASIDAEVDEFMCPVGLETCTGSSGADLPFSPDLKYSLASEYIWYLNSMDIIWNASYVYTDEIFSGAPGQEASDNPPALLPDYGIFTTSVAFSFNEDQYRISLIAKNLFDEQFVTTFSGDGFRYQVPRDAERVLGAQFRVNF